MIVLFAHLFQSNFFLRKFILSEFCLLSPIHSLYIFSQFYQGWYNVGIVNKVLGKVILHNGVFSWLILYKDLILSYFFEPILAVSVKYWEIFKELVALTCKNWDSLVAWAEFQLSSLIFYNLCGRNFLCTSHPCVRPTNIKLIRSILTKLTDHAFNSKEREVQSIYKPVISEIDKTV